MNESKHTWDVKEDFKKIPAIDVASIKKKFSSGSSVIETIEQKNRKQRSLRDDQISSFRSTKEKMALCSSGGLTAHEQTLVEQKSRRDLEINTMKTNREEMAACGSGGLSAHEQALLDSQRIQLLIRKKEESAKELQRNGSQGFALALSNAEAPLSGGLIVTSDINERRRSSGSFIAVESSSSAATGSDIKVNTVPLAMTNSPTNIQNSKFDKNRFSSESWDSLNSVCSSEFSIHQENPVGLTNSSAVLDDDQFMIVSLKSTAGTEITYDPSQLNHKQVKNRKSCIPSEPDKINIDGINFNQKCNMKITNSEVEIKAHFNEQKQSDVTGHVDSFNNQTVSIRSNVVTSPFVEDVIQNYDDGKLDICLSNQNIQFSPKERIQQGSESFESDSGLQSVKINKIKDGGDVNFYPTTKFIKGNSISSDCENTLSTDRIVQKPQNEVNALLIDSNGGCAMHSVGFKEQLVCDALNCPSFKLKLKEENKLCRINEECALNEIQKFYAERKVKQSIQKERNRNSEKEVLSRIAVVESENSWDRIISLIDSTDDICNSRSDRMRGVLLEMKGY